MDPGATNVSDTKAVIIYRRLIHLQNGPSLRLKLLARFQLTMSNKGRASHINGDGLGSTVHLEVYLISYWLAALSCLTQGVSPESLFSSSFTFLKQKKNLESSVICTSIIINNVIDNWICIRCILCMSGLTLIWGEWMRLHWEQMESCHTGGFVSRFREDESESDSLAERCFHP